MPKVEEYAPAWLSRPSPGFDFFTQKKGPKKDQLLGALDEEAYVGPRRTVARRGREIFAVIGNQIRWADLAVLKDAWQGDARARREGTIGDGQDGEPSDQRQTTHYRLLNTAVYGEITQLSMSPDGIYMAIVTRHTVHVAILPDPAHLASAERTPLRVKTFQLGPTVHVRPQEPVASALWHPLGVFDGHCGCIVTVTRDAIVRLWEIDRNNHCTFDKPTIAVDLKKLVDATSNDVDVSPSGFGHNKGFSADWFEMEVASACFGGSGFSEEDPWSPFTLWIAMRPGSVYALCPLLPARWQVPSLALSTLSETVMMRVAELDEEYDEEEEAIVLKQHKWLSDIDAQEPMPLPESCQWRVGSEMRDRPDGFSDVPKLQGPYYLDIDDAEDLDVTDIMVIPARTDLEGVLDHSEQLTADIEDGPLVTMLVLATQSGAVHTCLELEGVSASWLPAHAVFDTDVSPTNPVPLLPLETLQACREQSKRDFSWPLLTQDVQSRYGFFVTSACTITYLSLRGWAERVSKELRDPAAAGLPLRLKIICDGELAQREVIAKSTEPGFTCAGPAEHLPACLVFYDYDLGYLLLTYSPLRVHAVILDAPSFVVDANEGVGATSGESEDGLIKAPRRSPFQVPSIFYNTDPLAGFLEEHAPRDQSFLCDEVKMSAATLDVIVAAHGVLSAHTSTLERAASSLFIRAQRLGLEMRDQLNHLIEVSNRITSVNEKVGSVNADGSLVAESPSEDDDSLAARVTRAKAQQEQLTDRYDRIRGLIAKAGGKPLSLKERTWKHEIEALSQSLDATVPQKSGILPRFEKVGGASRLACHRSHFVGQVSDIEQVQTIAERLLAETKQLNTVHKSSLSGRTSQLSTRSDVADIPSGRRRQAVDQALAMVERECVSIPHRCNASSAC
ncbi:hypothetical protein KEM52_003691 [Ascosphaera acerosa]|nr:hypothetical protein KEM52_003691 [Ascosphaera acerosa]